MYSTLLAPEEESYPNRYRWTVEACYKLAEMGFLEGKFEILDGEVITKMGQKPPHAITLTRLMRVLVTLFGAEFLRIQAPITLAAPENTYTEPEPDAAVTRDTENAYTDRHPGPEDLLLVVEVSDTPLRTDTLVKARLYARVGIPEYWVLDLNSRRLHVHRDPVNDTYQTITLHTESESVTTLTRPESAVAVASLLPPVV